MSVLTLTQDQQNAYEAFVRFVIDPMKTVFVLEGFSGTGKSTLVTKLLDDLPKLLKTLRLINPDDPMRLDVALTATTNKAAENLAQITGEEVTTIHSKLGLRVHTDYSTGITKLVTRQGADIVTDCLLMIDEASYIDQPLLQRIFQRTERCKLVFIGDPAQLLNVRCYRSPVFDAGFETAKLTQVVRQAEGNPIMDLSAKFRETVNTGEFFSFVPDGTHIQYKPREEFDQEILTEFTRMDWKHSDSKVLAWTNKRVIAYNHGIRNLVKGDPQFAVGDYAVCNKYINNRNCNIKTDQLVHITGIEPGNHHGLLGNWYQLNHICSAFMPDDRTEWRNAIKQAQAEGRYVDVEVMTNHWIDLRAAYSCTINKSQGSTYDTVFIDLDDVKRCNNANQLARMLYVGVSRARNRVVLTGDLI